MIVQIKFNEQGKSISWVVAPGYKAGDTDCYDIPVMSKTGRYKKVNGDVSPDETPKPVVVLTVGELRRREYHSTGDQLDAIYKTFQGRAEISGSPMEAEISHWAAVKAKHPKP